MNPLAPWDAWDFRGEDLGTRIHQRRMIYLSRLPEGLYLARFLELSKARPMRFLGETRELAEQHAVDYINDMHSGTERRELVLADNDSSARSLLARTVAELEERKKRGGVRP